jgi:osmotically-inducible protein OsmY
MEADVRVERKGGAYAILVASVSALVACVSVPPKSPEQERADAAASVRAELGVTDEVLANAVYSDLNADPKYYFRHVDVRVDNGVAQLSGYVWSTDAIYRARTIARNVPGVTGVVTSQLELERNGRETSSVAR